MKWWVNWYGDRLHAVSDGARRDPWGRHGAMPICASCEVYDSAQTPYAERAMERRPPPKCKRCLRMIEAGSVREEES